MDKRSQLDRVLLKNRRCEQVNKAIDQAHICNSEKIDTRQRLQGFPQQYDQKTQMLMLELNMSSATVVLSPRQTNEMKHITISTSLKWFDFLACLFYHVSGNTPLCDGFKNKRYVCKICRQCDAFYTKHSLTYKALKNKRLRTKTQFQIICKVYFIFT